MTLRVKLILITTSVVTILFGISEWLSYQHTAELLDQYEAILTNTTDHSLALERLKATRDHMFLSVTTIRIVHAVGTLLIAVALLNYVWYRVVYRPIRRLLSQINIMGRGTWKSALPVKRNDEIGELTRAFNDLGQQLTSTFEYINTSSKLSALALIGTRLVRETTSVRGEITASLRSLEGCHDPNVPVLTATLTAAEEHLASLEAQFQQDFDRELSALSNDHRAAPEGTQAARAIAIAARGKH